jgi:sulfite exporter TauE/SafE
MKLDGFILGLSSGVACIAICAPVLVPYLLGEGKGIVSNYWMTGQFLFGRLLGYLLFAVLAWTFSSAILQETGQRNPIIGIAYILFSGLLISYGFFKKTDTTCKVSCNSNKYKRLLASQPALLPVAAGFATGLSFCPPFLLAFTGAVEQTSLLAAMLFFFSFFLGTSLLFGLAPFVGVFKRFPVLKIIGKMAAGLMGLYYLYQGIILIIGGLKTI